MNRIYRLGLAVVVAVALLGCPEQPALSLHGLDAATAVTQADLAGFWIVEPESVRVAEEANADDPPSEQTTPKRPLRETYVDIVPADGEAGRYTVTIRRGRQTNVLDARLVELEGGRIFDCRVVDEAAPADLKPHYTAPHMFFKVEPVEDGFTLSFLTQGFLEAHRKKGNLLTPHTMAGETPLLIGSPEEVQRFINEFANAGPAAEEGWRPLGAVLKRVDAQ